QQLKRKEKVHIPKQKINQKEREKEREFNCPCLSLPQDLSFVSVFINL
ncbi:unnamed protein product, partial [Brassica oleracea var. botrytis]